MITGIVGIAPRAAARNNGQVADRVSIRYTICSTMNTTGLLSHRKALMTQTLTLPGDVYRKLVRGAADRGMTIETLLTVVSELVVVPDQPTDQDRERSDRIERLLDRYRTGHVTSQDRVELDHLIETDYEAANARADRLISAKRRRTRRETSPSDRKPNGAASLRTRPPK
jgi:hypothetical protein